MTEPAEFCLPDLGEGLTDAEIVTWLVTPGDRVVTGQPLLTVETDKAVVDIPSPNAGVIDACLVDVGDVVEVGAPLVRFAAAGAQRDTGAVVGDLPGERVTPARPAGESASSVVSTEPATERSRPPPSPRASPRTRRRAHELGVDLAAVTATGPEGVIQLRDVEGATTGGERLIGVQRAMARRMADACARVARATVTGEADISAWQDRASPMVRLVRAIGVAATAEPLLNAAYDDVGEILRSNEVVDLGIAMESGDGLFVPVLRDVTGRSADDIETGLEQLEGAVQDRSIGPGELRGQTLTLSNFGAVGGLHAEMVVVPPQVAVVGAGRAFDRLVPAQSGQRVARILPLSVSFDHRVVTGVEACRFLNAMIADMEQGG